MFPPCGSIEGHVLAEELVSFALLFVVLLLTLLPFVLLPLSPSFPVLPGISERSSSKHIAESLWVSLALSELLSLSLLPPDVLFPLLLLLCTLLLLL